MWREILRIINEGTVEGLARSKYPVHEEAFLAKLRHSNEVFAAMKTHQMGEDMAKKLLDGNGKLKSFSQWKDDVSSIASHHVGHWLKTEYNTAAIRAHAAADWREFERNKDILPNLRWMPTTAAEPDSAHKAYWQSKLTLPVDDPFWNKHHPGDRWNCKCSLEATDEPEIRPDELKYAKPQRGLESNPGKTGEMFSNTHPYYPNSCSSCPFNKGIKNKAKSFFRNENKHCNECSKIGNAMKYANNDLKMNIDITPPSIESYEVSHHGMVYTSPYHGANEVNENKRLADFLVEKIGRKVYLLPRLDPQNPKQAHLRSSLLPLGVKERKNPDFYIGGLFFDGKSMVNIEKSSDNTKYHNDILNRIKSAKKQADNAILEIPTFVSRKIISGTIKGYLKQSSKDRIIIVKHGRKCYTYSGKYK